ARCRDAFEEGEKMKRISLLLLATCLSALAEQENKNDPALADARKAIDKGNAQWVEAWTKADASLITSLFAEDGVLMRRNGKLSKGPKEIFEAMKPVMESAGKGVKATVNTVDVW